MDEGSQAESGCGAAILTGGDDTAYSIDVCTAPQLDAFWQAGHDQRRI